MYPSSRYTNDRNLPESPHPEKLAALDQTSTQSTFKQDDNRYLASFILRPLHGHHRNPVKLLIKSLTSDADFLTSS